MPVGLVTYRDTATVPRPRWPGVVVRNRMTPLEDAVVVRPDDLLEDAWTALLGSPNRRALVLGGGLLSATDVLRILEARSNGTPGRSGRPAKRVTA